MAKRQLNSTEVITEGSLEATGLQRVLSISVLLFCIKDKSIVLMFPWEIQLLPSLFLGRESDSTKCEQLREKKPHFPPEAASASCQGLITASYKTLIWPSKWSKIPFLSSLQLSQCTARNWQSRGLHNSHTWSHWRLGRGGWGGQTDFASPPAFLLHTMVTAALNRQYFKILPYCFLSFSRLLQKWKAAHLLCVPAPKPDRENTSRKGKTQWGSDVLLCFEPGFSLFHVPGKKKQQFLRWKHLEQHWSGFCLGSKRGEQCT